MENLIDLVARPHRLVYGYFPKEYSRNSINKAVHRLTEKGYIQKGTMEDEICIKLTELGLKAFQGISERKIEKRFLNVKPKKFKWDGVWRVVIFDIPEENKRVRYVLRETLKILGFRPLQKSVWISKRNFTKEIRKWVKELKLSQYILIFETKDLGSGN